MRHAKPRTAEELVAYLGRHPNMTMRLIGGDSSNGYHVLIENPAFVTFDYLDDGCLILTNGDIVSVLPTDDHGVLGTITFDSDGFVVDDGRWVFRFEYYQAELN